MIKKELEVYFSYFLDKKDTEELKREAISKGYSIVDIEDTLSYLKIEKDKAMNMDKDLNKSVDEFIMPFKEKYSPSSNYDNLKKDVPKNNEDKKGNRLNLIFIFFIILIILILSSIVLIYIYESNKNDISNILNKDTSVNPLNESYIIKDYLEISNKIFDNPDSLYFENNPIEKENSIALSKNIYNCYDSIAKFTGNYSNFSGTLSIKKSGDNCIIEYKGISKMVCNYKINQTKSAYENAVSKDYSNIYLYGPEFYFGYLMELKKRKNNTKEIVRTYIDLKTKNIESVNCSIE